MKGAEPSGENFGLTSKTFGSVCSGIEAPSLAWKKFGWKPLWFSELEPFPCAVLDHYYPEVPNLGDMTKIVELLQGNMIQAPDILVGGTPCQAFSLAGLRQSLEDTRGKLTLEYVRIFNAIDEARATKGQPPAVCVWENVTGVLSTTDNAFGCFLAALVGESSPLQPAGKKWTNAGCVFGPQRAAAWRTLNSEFFGVAQRRRRVFVVASAREGFDPAKILFEFEGLRRDIAPQSATRQEVTEDVGRGFKPAEYSTMREPVGTLCARDYKGVGNQFFNEGKVIAQVIKADPLSQESKVQVRRLTPLEYERLQGFPDNFTNIPYLSGKGGCPDSVRYKSLGNSMAVPCMAWIAKRIESFELTQTEIKP